MGIKLKQGQDNIVVKGSIGVFYTLRKVEDGTYRAYWNNFKCVNEKMVYTIEDIENLINDTWELISGELEETTEDIRGGNYEF